MTREANSRMSASYFPRKPRSPPHAAHPCPWAISNKKTNKKTRYLGNIEYTAAAAFRLMDYYLTIKCQKLQNVIKAFSQLLTMYSRFLKRGTSKNTINAQIATPAHFEKHEQIITELINYFYTNIKYYVLRYSPIITFSFTTGHREQIVPLKKKNRTAA